MAAASKQLDAKVGGENMPVTTVRKHSKVVITLENVLIPNDKLISSPSQQDGLDNETETNLRILGCELIQTSGILLKLPQVAMATGQVILQRFYYTKSLVRYPMETTAMACIALASKIEEDPRKIRDVINVFSHIKQVKNGKTIQPVILDGNYIALKNQVVKAERRLLKELGFCCHVKHPHKIIIMYLRLLEAEQKKLAQSSWNYMNDALRTDAFVRHSPETIACACIWLAGRQLKICLPESPPWYHVFRSSLSDIEVIAASILKLYTRKKIKLEVLEARVEEIRKEQQEARLRNKAVNSLQTPKELTTFSPLSRTNSPSKRGYSPHCRKRSSSPDRRGDKDSGSSQDRSSRSRSRSSNRHARKKAKHSHSASGSHSNSRSRSHSRDRYHGKKKSRTPSPSVTPPPRFIKNKEKGSIIRSVSRSRSRSPLPHRGYDKYDRNLDKYDKYDRLDKKPVDRYDKFDRMEKNDRYRDDRYDRRYDNSDKVDKYNQKYQDKLEKKKIQREGKREAKKYYDNGYEKQQRKSKKHDKQRSRSNDKDNRRR